MSLRRLDRELVDRGLLSSRTKAQEHIALGRVLVDGVVATKPSLEVTDGSDIELVATDRDVGRGAKKLRHALSVFPLPVTGQTAVDLGASTGGFTQVLLEAGAEKVVAIDVGHGQLSPSLTNEPRVINLEGVNVTQLSKAWWAAEDLPSPVGLIVADLSFVSLRLVAGPMVETFGVHSHYLLLVKPQFEVGRGRTSRGVVKDGSTREGAVLTVVEALREQGLVIRGVIVSPITGEKGNVEYFVYASATPSVYPAEWDGQLPRP